MCPYLSGGFPLVLLVLLLGMGLGDSGRDASCKVSALGSDVKTLSSGLVLAVAEESILSIEGIISAVGVMCFKIRQNWN